MRTYISRLATVAFSILLSIRLQNMLQEPSRVRAYLSITYSRLTRPIIGGLAPRISCNAPKELLDPDAYSIILKSGHTIEKHKRAIGRAADIDAVTKKVLDYDFPGFQIEYWFENAGAGLVDAIRADPGVDFAECDIVQELFR